MATIDMRRPRGRVDAAAVTVHQTHRAVCAARSSRFHRRRNESVQHSRRTRREQVSRYLEATMTRTETPTTAPRSEPAPRPNHRVALPVLTITAVLGLMSVILLRALDPATNGRPVLLVVCLIAIAGAVILNAITMCSTSSSARVSHRSGEGSGSRGRR